MQWHIIIIMQPRRCVPRGLVVSVPGRGRSFPLRGRTEGLIFEDVVAHAVISPHLLWKHGHLWLYKQWCEITLFT